VITFQTGNILLKNGKTSFKFKQNMNQNYLYHNP
jgi:hypothetical protein